jgi:hypothetical protein
MADDTESEIGDATEITDESQNDEVVSQLSENIDTHSLQEVEKTQDGSETEEVSEVSELSVNNIWKLILCLTI